MNFFFTYLLSLIQLAASLPPNLLLPHPSRQNTTSHRLNFALHLPYTVPIPNFKSITLTITLAHPSISPFYLPYILNDIKHLELDLWSRHTPDETPNLYFKVGDNLRGELKQAKGTPGVRIRVLLEVLRKVREIYESYGAVKWMVGDIKEEGRPIGELQVRWFTWSRG